MLARFQKIEGKLDPVTARAIAILEGIEREAHP
jgi:hypothetical protein